MVVAGGQSDNETENKKKQKKSTTPEKEEKETEKFFVMAAVPQRSRSFHSLSLPVFKWGRRKQLRFGNNDNGDAKAVVDRISSIYRRSPPSSCRLRRENGEYVGRRSDTERRRRSLFEPEKFGNSPLSWYTASEIGQKRRRSVIGGEEDDGIEAVRTKLMLDFQTEVDRMKVAILKEGNEEIETSSRTEEEIRPWNLRPRRSPPKDTDVNGAATAGKSLRVDDRKPNGSPLRNENKLPRLRSKTAAAAGGEHAGDWGPGGSRGAAKLSLSLSKSEIEEDFIAITGSKPQRRQKRRPRSVQKQLDCIFPGLWLSEITPEMYKVNENLEAAKVIA
ncbi:hypothetical protein Dimus_014684 [Dionaea muscipula]